MFRFQFKYHVPYRSHCILFLYVFQQIQVPRRKKLNLEFCQKFSVSQFALIFLLIRELRRCYVSLIRHFVVIEFGSLASNVIAVDLCASQWGTHFFPLCHDWCQDGSDWWAREAGKYALINSRTVPVDFEKNLRLSRVTWCDAAHSSNAFSLRKCHKFLSAKLYIFRDVCVVGSKSRQKKEKLQLWFGWGWRVRILSHKSS